MFYSQHHLSLCIPTSQVLYSLLDLSPTVSCSHQYGKLWMFLSLLHHCSHSAFLNKVFLHFLFYVPVMRKLLVYSVGMERPGTYQTSLSFLKTREVQSMRGDFHRPSGKNQMILQKQNDVIPHVGTEMFFSTITIKSVSDNGSPKCFSRFKSFSRLLTVRAPMRQRITR